jgi:hypothetical protein
MRQVHHLPALLDARSRRRQREGVVNGDKQVTVAVVASALHDRSFSPSRPHVKGPASPRTRVHHRFKERCQLALIIFPFSQKSSSRVKRLFEPSERYRYR